MNEEKGETPELQLEDNTPDVKPEPPAPPPPEEKAEPPADEAKAKAEEPYRATCYAGSFRRVPEE